MSALPSTDPQELIDRIPAVDRAWALWRLQARRSQLPPEGDWLIWLLLAGRGFGKGKAASNWLARKAQKAPPESEFVVLAPTFSDMRRICIENPRSGLLVALGGEGGPWVEQGAWNRSVGELRLRNGTMIYGISADKPDRLRGLNLSGAWLDEMCSMVHVDELWNEALTPALRVGEPQVAISTTPRPIPLLKELVDRDDGSVRLVRGTTWENAANLPPAILDELRARYGGTRTGRQELEGEILEDVEGALWQREWMLRVDAAPPLRRVVVSVDPATTSHDDSDETGIVVAGVAGRGNQAVGFVLADLSMQASPGEWGKAACRAAVDHEADAIVYESNQGGDMVAHVIKGAWGDLTRSGEANGPMPRLVGVHASRGKLTRAEPVAAQWEQGRWFLVGPHAELEDQMCSWVPGEGNSPDRMDALVWAAYELTVPAVHTPATSGAGILTGSRLPSTAGSALLGGRRSYPGSSAGVRTFGR